MKTRTLWLFCGVLVLASVLVAWALTAGPITVEIAVASIGQFEQTVDEQAKTRIRDHYLVSSPLNGELDRISLREGDAVALGAIVARLHPALAPLLDSRTELELRRRVEAARASKERADARVAQAQIGLAQAQLEVERSRKLAEAKLVAMAKLEGDELAFQMSARELDSARAEAHVALHDIDIAVAALTRAREAARGGGESEWALRAPIGGRVLRVHQKSGGTVAAGTPLIELGDLANLEVVIELLTTQATQVVPGALVRFDNWGGTAPLIGRVRHIEPWGFTKISALGVEEQRVNVIVDIATPQAQWSALADGYRLDAHIRIYERRNALRVPTGALFRTGDQWQLYTVNANRRARRTLVTVGRRNETSAEILAGLKERDEVIVYPSDAVVDQTRVTPAVGAQR